MKSQRKRTMSAATSTTIVVAVLIICTVVGVVSAASFSSSSTSSSSSSIRGSGSIAAAAPPKKNRQQELRHSIMEQHQQPPPQQQHQRSLLQREDNTNNGKDRHRRKSDEEEDDDDNNLDPSSEQQQSQQQQQQYSWNVNPDKLQAMLAATSTSDSDRQEEEDDDNNMVSMSAGAAFAQGDDHQPVADMEVQNDDEIDSEVEPESDTNDDDDIGIAGLSVYSLPENTPPSDGTSSSITPPTTALPGVTDDNGTTTTTSSSSSYYFPIWSDTVQGCTSYATPPEEYIVVNDEIQHLFDTKLDCCSAWFQKLEEYESCLDEMINLTDYPVAMKELGMEYEVVEKERDDDDDDDMITLSDTATTTIGYGDMAPSAPQSQPLPTHEQEYYPTDYEGGDSAPAPSPQSYYPDNFEGGDDAPAPIPQSQPLPNHEQGYYPANYVGRGTPAPSPQSQPLPTHEQGYYPTNFDPDAPPPPPPAESNLDPTIIDEDDAISGDSIISDLVLEAKMKDNTIMPALNLQSSPENGRWDITKTDDDYDGGKYVLSANTRKVILGMAANSHGITTYQGQATMSITILAGPAGGILTFGTYSNARAPIEVLQMKVDDLPMIAVTSPSSEWVEHMLEIPPGMHVITFEHISNPENLSMKELEGFGKPGSSMVDGLKYVDNVGEPLEEFTSSAISEGPTSSPWSESDDEETTDTEDSSSSNVSSTTLPMQNYCGKTLALIQETCYTADAPPTCNNGDGPCPEGLFCWGNVECHVPEGEVAEGVSATMTPPPTNAPTQVITGRPTASPTGMSSESFLDSFIFGSDEGGQPSSSNQVPVLEDDAQEQAKQVGCSEGLPSIQGHAGCCVPEPTFLGDGACDAHAPYNTAECGYDLGDCCKESCDTEAQFGCKAKEGDAYGPFGFYCLDPQYSTIDENCTTENREWIGDGGCDEEFNTQACGWDGGDCCQESCDTEFAYYECGREEQPFNCLDPNIIQFNAPGKI